MTLEHGRVQRNDHEDELACLLPPGHLTTSPPPVYWMGPHLQDIYSPSGTAADFSGWCFVSRVRVGSWSGSSRTVTCIPRSIAVSFELQNEHADDSPAFAPAGRPTWSWLTELDRAKAQSLLRWLDTPLPVAGQRPLAPPAWSDQLQRMLDSGVKAEIEIVHNHAPAATQALAAWVWTRLAAPQLWL